MPDQTIAAHMAATGMTPNVLAGTVCSMKFCDPERINPLHWQRHKSHYTVKLTVTSACPIEERITQ